MKRTMILAAGVAALVVAGCGGGSNPAIDPPQPGFADIRAIHASPDAGPVNVTVRGNQVASGLAYRASFPASDQPAVAVESGVAEISVTPVEATTSLTISPTLANDTIYTAIVAGLAANSETDTLRYIVLSDARNTLNAGQMNLRIVHAAPAAGNVDVYVTEPSDEDLSDNTPTVANLARYESSALLQLNAGTYRVRVTAAGSTTPLIDVNDVNVFGGTYGTIVAQNNDTNDGAVLEAYVGSL